MKIKFLKWILISVLSLIGLLIIVVGGYIGYISIQYYRLPEELDLTDQIEANQSGAVVTETSYTISTFNIGFGAYTRDFSFFMDSGEMLDGEKIVGTGSKAASVDIVHTNTNGAIRVVSEYDPDFMFFQEVDIDATRSHHINQYKMLKDAFQQYGTSFAHNFHSAFLFYPIFDPHGATEAGIATFSKYEITSSVRYKLPIDESFPNKFFDLDRCFMISRVPVSGGHELVLINVHLSAYDEGGIIRQAQLVLLNSILEAEAALGHYVIVGGDFNHDIASSLNTFPTEQKIPEWVYVLESSQLPTGYSFASSNLNPTCRSTDMSYIPGVNYTVSVDGFIISSNISIVSVNNIVTLGTEDVNFLYSDHNCVVFEFKLND
ncbi:MAG: endonuclease/exonuclease/phosphatase family protein [Bacilli bacterium]